MTTHIIECLDTIEACYDNPRYSRQKNSLGTAMVEAIAYVNGVGKPHYPLPAKLLLVHPVTLYQIDQDMI